MLLVSTLWALFQFPSVQTYAGKKLTNYFSKELNTTLSIEAVEIDFWNVIYLDNFYLEDQNRDTLAYLNRLELRINSFDLKTKSLDLNLSLNQGSLNISKAKGEKYFNHHFLTDYFSSERKAGSFSWDVSVSKLNLVDNQFSFNDDNYPRKDAMLDFFHISVSDLQFRAQGLNYSNDTLVGTVEKIKFSDKNGFSLERFESDITISDGFVDLEDLKLETVRTAFYGDLQLKGDSFSGYNNFYENVYLKSDINGSIIHLGDLAYFVPGLQGLKDALYIDGEVEGTISNIEAENLEIKFDQFTRLKGDFSLRGLPDFENTFIFFELDEFRTNAAGIRNIPLPPFASGKKVKLPTSFDRLGTIDFKGNFTGYLTDFVAYGSFNTDLGRVNTDLSFKEKGNDDFHYKGSLKTKNFNIGEFVDLETLKKVSLDLELDGRGISKETINAAAKGNINSVVYKGYDYKNIVVNGAFDKETFSGDFAIEDENLDLSFSGVIDVNKKTPKSRFSLRVNKAKLAKLNLYNQLDSLTELQFNSIINLSGNDIDEFSGVAILDSIRYIDSKMNHLVKEIKFKADYDGNNRDIEVNSSLLDARLKGSYQFKTLKQVASNVMDQLFPTEGFDSSIVDKQEFDLELLIKDIDPLTTVLYPEIVIERGTKLTLQYNTQKEKGKLLLTSDKIEYKNNTSKELEVQLSFLPDTHFITIESIETILNATSKIEELSIISSLVEDRNSNQITWKAVGDNIGKGELNINNKINSFSSMLFSFQNSSVYVNDSLWAIPNDNSISLDSSRLFIEEWSIKNGIQQVYLEGYASDKVGDTISMGLQDIDLEFISSLLPKNSVYMKGTANGKTEVIGILGDLSLTTDLKLDSLEVNNIEIGNSIIQSKWDPEQEALIVNANLGELGADLLKLSGIVYPLKQENSLDLELSFNGFPLALVQPYLVDYISGIEGEIFGKLEITGESNLPNVRGQLDLKAAAFKVEYLGTSYSINDQLIIEPDYIGFNLIEIYDTQGSKAIATGTVFHENYSDFNYDIGLEFENFLALNTTSYDNDLYYGRGVTSGNANISGYDNQLIIELDLTTEQGTDFNIPLSEGVDVSNSNFLVFTNSPEYKQEERDEVDLSGIQMNFNLNITPAADVKIIFDEQVGDVIRAQGQGELKLEINTIGDFNIYGQYVVEKGDYLFTLQNIVNKQFDLADGSSIYWDGNPYQAVIDMQAIYNLRAPLFDLFPEDTTSGFRRRIPIELELQLTESLLNPEIGFDIRLPTADENTKRRLESILYVNNSDVNPQEMNQQVFGLLVLNRFLPSASSSTATESYNRGTPGINNGYEFVSNQLSNWFSRLSDQFDVGLKYRPADELNSNEVDFSLSTEVLNDRLLLDGNFGYTGDSPQYDNQYSGFIGEFTAEYKLSRDGRYRVKGFNRSVSNSLLQLNSPYTQGVGLFYREEFDKVGELWKKYFGKKD